MGDEVISAGPPALQWTVAAIKNFFLLAGRSVSALARASVNIGREWLNPQRTSKKQEWLTALK